MLGCTGLLVLMEVKLTPPAAGCCTSRIGGGPSAAGLEADRWVRSDPQEP